MFMQKKLLMRIQVRSPISLNFGELVGYIAMTSEFTPSLFADNLLFFKHQKREEDFSHKSGESFFFIYVLHPMYRLGKALP